MKDWLEIEREQLAVVSEKSSITAEWIEKVVRSEWYSTT